MVSLCIQNKTQLYNLTYKALAAFDFLSDHPLYSAIPSFQSSDVCQGYSQLRIFMFAVYSA